MTSSLAALPDVRGLQHPRLEWVPPHQEGALVEALEVCDLAGLVLDPWQERVLGAALGERPDGRWAAPEVGLCCPRQNGKGSILEARELAGLFILDERFIVHSAHQFDTSLEAFARLLARIEGVPEFDSRIKRVSRSHGEEGIELRSGQRIRFRTRTKGGGRGFTADCVILDEAMYLPEKALDALLPTLSARPNPQIWYTGSAVDQEADENGVAFSRVRARGLKQDPRLAFFEWSVDAELATLSPLVAGDPRRWAQANPGLSIRIMPEWVEGEFRGGLSPRGFAVERLGIGDWPDPDAVGGIAFETWRSVCDPKATAVGELFALDANPGRSAAAICAISTGPVVELVDFHAGLGWVVDRAVELHAKNRRAKFVIDRNGPAGVFIDELTERKVPVIELDTTDMARACGSFVDLVDRRGVTVRQDDDLDSAVLAAVKRPVGDAWVWGRKPSKGDISPLVAATAGVWALLHKAKGRPRVVSMADALRNAGELD